MFIYKEETPTLRICVSNEKHLHVKLGHSVLGKKHIGNENLLEDFYVPTKCVRNNLNIELMRILLLFQYLFQ